MAILHIHLVLFSCLIHVPRPPLFVGEGRPVGCSLGALGLCGLILVSLEFLARQSRGWPIGHTRRLVSGRTRLGAWSHVLGKVKRNRAANRLAARYQADFEFAAR